MAFLPPSCWRLPTPAICIGEKRCILTGKRSDSGVDLKTWTSVENAWPSLQPTSTDKTHTFVANRAGYFEDLVNGKNSRVGEGGRGEGLDGLRRDPQVAATWLTNNLFGLLKDQLGGKEGETGEGHGQGGGDSDSEGELER